MEIDRRQFVTFTAGAIAATALCGCAANASTKPMPTAAGVPVDAGPETDFAADGVYDGFKDRGFFLVRRGAELFAVASICTHRNCRLRPQKDSAFLCPCHGSKFDPDGKVTRGPATHDLAHFQIHFDDRRHVLVTLKPA